MNWQRRVNLQGPGSIAERESLRLTAELAKEVAERVEIEKQIAQSSETHMSRFDAQEVFLCHSE